MVDFRWRLAFRLRVIECATDLYVRLVVAATVRSFRRLLSECLCLESE